MSVLMAIIDGVFGTFIQKATENVWSWLMNTSRGRRILVRLNLRQPTADSDFDDIYIYAVPRYLIRRSEEDANFRRISNSMQELLNDKAVLQLCQKAFRTGDISQMESQISQYIERDSELDAKTAMHEMGIFMGVVDDIVDETTPVHLKRAERALRSEVAQMVQQQETETQSSPSNSISFSVSSRSKVVQSAFDVPNLPAEFIGREQLITRISPMLDDGKPVLLQGFGGEGKTTLAAKLAADWLDFHDRNLLWLTAGTEDANTLFESLATAFNVQKQMAQLDIEARVAFTAKLLREQDIGLVVIDDEWEKSALRALTKAIPADTAVLVTSRLPIGFGTLVEITALEQEDALALLHHHANSIPRDPEADTELVERVNRLAFAVEIAGKTMQENGYSARELLDKMNQPHELTLPDEYIQTEREDRRSVVNLINASLSAVDDETEEIFLVFGAFFVPSMTPELVALYLDERAGIHPENLPGLTEQAESGLQKLRRIGLANRVMATEDSIAHYHIHDLAYSYAKAQNDDDQRTDALDACLRYVDHYNTPSPENFRALRPEINQFIAGQTWGLKQERYDDVIQLARSLYAREGSQVLEYLGLYRRAETILKNAVSAARTIGDRETEATFIGRLGHVAQFTGEMQQSAEYYEQALALGRELGNRTIESDQLSNLGLVYRKLGQYRKALDYCEQALDLTIEMENRQGEGIVLSNIGVIYRYLGEYDQAIEQYERALEIAREQGDQRGEASRLGNIGIVYTEIEKYDEAIATFEQVLALAHEMRDRRIESIALGSLGDVYRKQEKFSEAIEVYQKVLPIFQETSDRRNEGSWLGKIGMAYADMKEYDEAGRYYERALAIAIDTLDRQREGEWLECQGNLYLETGECEKAIQRYESALAIWQELELDFKQENSQKLLEKAQGQCDPTKVETVGDAGNN